MFGFFAGFRQSDGKPPTMVWHPSRKASQSQSKPVKARQAENEDRESRFDVKPSPPHPARMTFQSFKQSWWAWLLCLALAILAGIRRHWDGVAWAILGGVGVIGCMRLLLP